MRLTPNEAITSAFNILPVKMAGKEARLVMLAIQLQEDPELLRVQKGCGAARGIFQFEKGGGVKGVLNHPTTKRDADRVCELRQVFAHQSDVWNTLEHDDVLAAAFARMLLWTDPAKLPAIGEVRNAFDLYIRTWRPGAYARGNDLKKAALYTKWQLNYAKAMDQIGA
jgi:hypothetical protein